MAELILNGLILLMVGANFVCLRVVVGTWLVTVLGDNRLAQHSVNLAAFTVAVLLTLWGLTNYLSQSEPPGPDQPGRNGSGELVALVRTAPPVDPRRLPQRPALVLAAPCSAPVAAIARRT